MRYLFLLGLILAVTTSQAADEALDWLMRVNVAAQNLSYKGVFVYQHDEGMDSMEVVHVNNQGSVKERLFSLNGAAREVVRDMGMVWCYLPDQKVGIHEYQQVSDRSFPAILPAHLEDLQKHYRVSMGDSARVANRQTRLIKVEPKDPFRYGYLLWADEESGLLLRSILTTQIGETLEQYMFVQVTIGEDITPIELKPQTPRESLVWYGDEKATENADDVEFAWEVEEVPAGFMLSRQIRRKSPTSLDPVDHYVYTDGLAAVSVFIRTADASSASMKGMNKIGATHAFTRQQGDHQITVVGEVPEATVSLIGMSVKKH